MKSLTLIAITILLSMNCLAKPDSSKVGYFICISADNKYAITKTIEIAEVYAVMELCFHGNCIQVEKQLSRTDKPIFEMYAGDLGIYIEKKTLVKVKKNGKLKLRRLKNGK